MPITDTKEHILDVAQQFFAEQGFAGTTLRSVIREAGVNQAAVHYHFGSKEELFSAVVQRMIVPIIQAQLEQLSHYEEQAQAPSVEKILEALFAPPLRIIHSLGNEGVTLAHFIARCQSEPEPVQKLIEKDYAETRQRFIGAFQRALPNLPTSEIEWRFELALAILTRVLISFEQFKKLLGEDFSDVETTTQRLINFTAPGIKANVPNLTQVS